MRLVFFGTPEFALPSLRALLDSGRHEVALVVSKPGKPKGRHQVVETPPVVALAERHGIQALQPKNVKGPGLEETLRDTGAEAGIVVAYGRLLPPNLLDLFPHGLINLHPSLLPRHRGPAPIQWALVCGDRSTGVSTMRLDEGMDTGPLFLQRRVSVHPRDTAETLAPRLAEAGAELMLETVDGLEAGRLEPHPQPKEGVTVTPMLRRSFGDVDWSMPARVLVNRLRGFTPWPGLFTKLRGGRIKLHGLEEVSGPPGGEEEPGTVLAVEASGIVVRCGRGTAVRVTELQREGRRRLPVDAFLIGERIVRGERFD